MSASSARLQDSSPLSASSSTGGFSNQPPQPEPQQQVLSTSALGALSAPADLLVALGSQSQSQPNSLHSTPAAAAHANRTLPEKLERAAEALSQPPAVRPSASATGRKAQQTQGKAAIEQQQQQQQDDDGSENSEDGPGASQSQVNVVQNGRNDKSKQSKQSQNSRGKQSAKPRRTEDEAEEEQRSSDSERGHQSDISHTRSSHRRTTRARHERSGGGAGMKAFLHALPPPLAYPPLPPMPPHMLMFGPPRLPFPSPPFGVGVMPNGVGVPPQLPPGKMMPENASAATGPPQSLQPQRANIQSVGTGSAGNNAALMPPMPPFPFGSRMPMPPMPPMLPPFPFPPPTAAHRLGPPKT